MDIQDLDKTIEFLYNKKGRKCSKDGIYDTVFRRSEDINVDAILRYLAEQKYIIMEETPQSSSPHAYYISYQGIVFYETGSIKGKPIQSLYRKEKIKKWHEIIKTTAIAINGIAILIFSGIQAYNSFSTKSGIEKENQQKTLKKQTQEVQVLPPNHITENHLAKDSLKK